MSSKIKWAEGWRTVSPRFLPFADAATRELPMGRMLRLSLFQVSAGMAIVLLNGTLNRVMVIELGLSTWLVALMVALPLLIAPFRALIGHRSDQHQSLLGWRRVPYIWMGTLLQFGGLAIMPFALLVLSSVDTAPSWVGQAAAALAFLLVGIGLHTTQTAGLALATDLAPERVRPRVVSLLYVMLLVGMVVSSLAFSALLADFSEIRLIKVVQGAAAATFILNIAALWKQEARNPAKTRPGRARPSFSESWSAFRQRDNTVRLLVAIGLGTIGFSMQDILLEPYGAEILGLSVSATTGLTAVLVIGMLAALALAAQRLNAGTDPLRIAGFGAMLGAYAFALVTLSGPLESAFVFRCGVVFIGFGGGLFAVGTLVAIMAFANEQESGIALGAWGAVQATAAGTGIALGGLLRDGITKLAESGSFGPAMTGPLSGYGAVYLIEILFLFLTLVAIGPLARYSLQKSRQSDAFGLPNFPG